MGTPRWQLREMEQQDLLEKLLKRVDEETEKHEDSTIFNIELAECSLSDLHFVHRMGWSHFVQWRRGAPHPRGELRRLTDELVFSIQEFVRVPEEGSHLYWRVGEKVLERAGRSFSAEYSRATFKKEEQLFGGKRTDEV